MQKNIMTEQKLTKPENLVEISNEFKYCLNDIIFKGKNCQIFRGYNENNDISKKGNILINVLANNQLSKDNNTLNFYNNCDKYICIKKEPPFLKNPQLKEEVIILKYLQQFLEEDNGNKYSFIPKIIDYYSSEESNSYLIEELFGSSVETVFQMSHHKFPPIVALIIVRQMLEITEKLHDLGIIHRNLNPSHFLFSRKITTDIFLSNKIEKEIVINPESQLYLIDYAESKFYSIKSSENKESEKNIYNHIKFSDKLNDLHNNENFCSIWAELKMEQSRRDDLYSILYILIYLLTGKLPWSSDNSGTKKERIERIRNMKLSFSPFELCQKINKCIINDLNLFCCYLNGLTFEDKPNYKYLNELINKMISTLKKSGIKENYCSSIILSN